jgi:hypothetical protein
MPICGDVDMTPLAVTIKQKDALDLYVLECMFGI